MYHATSLPLTVSRASNGDVSPGDGCGFSHIATWIHSFVGIVSGDTIEASLCNSAWTASGGRRFSLTMPCGLRSMISAVPSGRSTRRASSPLKDIRQLVRAGYAWNRKQHSPTTGWRTVAVRAPWPVHNKPAPKRPSGITVIPSGNVSLRRALL